VLAAYEKFLDEQTRIILSAEGKFFKLLKGK